MIRPVQGSVNLVGPGEGTPTHPRGGRTATLARRLRAAARQSRRDARPSMGYVPAPGGQAAPPTLAT